MEPISKENVLGFNKETYVIKVFNFGTHKQVCVSWTNQETGNTESINVLKNNILDNVEPLLESVRKAIIEGQNI